MSHGVVDLRGDATRKRGCVGEEGELRRAALGTAVGEEVERVAGGRARGRLRWGGCRAWEPFPLAAHRHPSDVLAENLRVRRLARHAAVVHGVNADGDAVACGRFRQRAGE